MQTNAEQRAGDRPEYHIASHQRVFVVFLSEAVVSDQQQSPVVRDSPLRQRHQSPLLPVIIVSLTLESSHSLLEVP